jgi:hypothetical protein
MKRAVLALLTILTVTGFSPETVSASQQFYLSTSPDGKTRVVVSQRLLRRVEDRLFFEYPVSMVNVKTGKRFELFSAGAPLVKETPRGTFGIDVDAFKVEWAPESGDLAVVFLRTDSDTWNVSLVDRAAKSQMDLMPMLKKGLQKKAASSKLECSVPVVSVFKWLTPLKPVFTLDTECGKVLKVNKDMRKLAPLTHWVLYDSEKKVIKDCVGCEEEKAIKLFSKKPKPTPTATPVEELTPTAE